MMTDNKHAVSLSGQAGVLMRHLQSFLKLLFGRFVAHDGMQNAAGLTYTTLLSLVPLMTVVLAVVGAFPVAEKVSEVIEDFVFENFVPASGEVVQQYLAEFSSKASRLTGVGFAFLLVVALMMMANIDRALNAIWEVKRKRGLVNKFLVYWAILSLGPVLIGASVLVTSYLVSLPLLSDAVRTGIVSRVLELTPVLASTMGFSLIYILVPNKRVPGRDALLGGLLAAVLFEVAKRVFGYYVSAFPTYEAIYGTLATIPIFLIWVYLSWLIVLLGAEFTSSLSLYRIHHGVPAERGRIEDIVRLILFLGEAQSSGQAWSEKDIRSRDHGLEELLPELHDEGLVYRTEEGYWLLAESLADITLYDLYGKGRYRLPLPGEADWPTDNGLAKVLQQAHDGQKSVLDVALQDIYTISEQE